MSLALEPADNGMWLHVVRSDSVTFATFIPVPLPSGTRAFGDWYHDIDPAQPPGFVPRQVGHVWSTGLIFLATDNFIYGRQNGGWVRINGVGSASSTPGPNVFLSTNTVGIALTGTNPTALGPFLYLSNGHRAPGFSVQRMPRSDVPPPFFAFGYTTPVSCDFDSACYAVQGTHQPTGRFAAGIYFTRASQGGWSPWGPYPTTVSQTFSDVGNAWSIQSGFSYRGKSGELFVIGGGYRLMNWVP